MNELNAQEKKKCHEDDVYWCPFRIFFDDQTIFVLLCFVLWGRYIFRRRDRVREIVGKRGSGGWLGSIARSLLILHDEMDWSYVEKFLRFFSFRYQMAADEEGDGEMDSCFGYFSSFSHHQDILNYSCTSSSFHWKTREYESIEKVSGRVRRQTSLERKGWIRKHSLTLRLLWPTSWSCLCWHF